jgi:hypothetical protein
MDGDYPECDKARALSYDSPFMRLFIPDLSPWPDLISEINMSSERVTPSGVAPWERRVLLQGAKAPRLCSEVRFRVGGGWERGGGTCTPWHCRGKSVPLSRPVRAA